MKKFMLLMRGPQDYFIELSDLEQAMVIKKYSDWAKELKSRNLLIDGNGFSHRTKKIIKKDSALQIIDKPYASTADELSGYYIIQTHTIEDAVAIAGDCPALNYGETVEVVPLGH